MPKGIITGRNETRRKQLNHLEVKYMRILEGWTDEERKELEEAKDNNYSSAMILIHGIGEEYSDCQALYEKYYREDTNDNNQMARDIADYYAGVAKFPDKKYYVHFIKSDRNSYLNISWNDDHRVAEVGGNFEFGGLKTKFTRDEVIAIDPRFVPFMEEVEK